MCFTSRLFRPQGKEEEAEGPVLSSEEKLAALEAKFGKGKSRSVDTLSSVCMCVCACVRA